MLCRSTTQVYISPFQSKLTTSKPFREKAARAGVSAQLASFLLYSLSPFHPNPDILENKDLLTELTKQYKVRQFQKSQS